MNELYYNAGERIRNLRVLQNLTREQLAEKASITPQFLYDIEMGRKGFSADTLYRIATALAVKSDYILTGYETHTMTNELADIINLYSPSQISLIKQILECTYKLSEQKN